MKFEGSESNDTQVIECQRCDIPTARPTDLHTDGL